VYTESTHLQQQFPNLTGGDGERFKTWLTQATDIFDLPDSVRQFAGELDFERSVGRVIGKVMRIPHLASAVRKSGLTRAHLHALIALAQAGHGYGPDDLVVADWWLQQLGDAANRRIAEVLPPEADDDGFVDYRSAWIRRHAGEGKTMPPPGRAAAKPAAWPPSLEKWSLRLGARLSQLTGATHPGPGDATLDPPIRGVNVFGYFKSPIGLGAASTGLCQALEIAGYQHRDILLPNDAIDDITLDDLFPDLAFHFPWNVVVSYPHIEYQLQATRPRCFFEGRETIGYFAWEQRDFPASWAARLAPYDRLWALSRFAAEAIASGVGRPVSALPCSVETGPGMSKPEARAKFGIPLDKFVVGYIFDAASSIERKNPWALLTAVFNAFERADDVLLVLKIGNGRRPDFVARVNEIAQQAQEACRHVIIITDTLPKRDVEALLCAMDVYVSLHRSEGFGYTLAEAMLLGVPVVATAYSGNLDFMRAGTSHLVSCREVPVRRRDGPFETGTVWAEPDPDHAVSILRGIRADYPAAAAKALLAIEDARAIVSPAAVANAVAALLEGSSAPAAEA
jgi:glycosyltransferase involved in cell wall biosynthesis